MVRIGNRGLGAGIFALLVFLAFFIVMFVATALHVRVGAAIYLLGFLAVGLGFYVREDTFAMGSIMGLSLLIILDIYANIGVLTHW